MKLFAAACQNGLGHFMRMTRILDVLLELRPGLDVTIAAGDWQWHALKDEAHVARIEARINKMDAAEHPLRLAGIEDLDELSMTRADENIFASRACLDADVAWSDNITAILRYRSDALLSGSFLWSAVLPDCAPQNEFLRRWAKEERALLEKHRPQVICVGAMAMPDVLMQPNVRQCSLMIDADESGLRTQSQKPAVGIFGGATGLHRDTLARIGAALVKDGCHVVAPARLELPFDDFNFDASSWRQLDAALCRPGLGTIHDCARAGVYMFAHYDVENTELCHNAGRLSELGIGVDLGHHEKPEAAVRTWLAAEEDRSTDFAKLSFGGHREAAEILSASLPSRDLQRPTREAVL